MKVTVKIPKEELVALVVDALHSMYTTSSEEETLYRALGNLVGITDVEAVKIANRDTSSPPITTKQFRRWLPQVLAEAFAELLGVEATLK